MTQCQMILQMMEDNGSISSMEAYAEGITRLASRIHDLKRMGYEIASETVYAKNRFGKPIHYSRYKKAV